MTVVSSFVNDPVGPLDLACLDILAPVDVSGQPGAAYFAFGVTDPWENVSASPNAIVVLADPEPPPGWDAVKRRFRGR